MIRVTLPLRSILLQAVNVKANMLKSPFPLLLLISFRCCDLSQEIPPADPTENDFRALSCCPSVA